MTSPLSSPCGDGGATSLLILVYLNPSGFSIIISIIVFEKRVEPINLVGFGVFFAGVSVYSVLTHRARLAARRTRTAGLQTT